MGSCLSKSAVTQNSTAGEKRRPLTKTVSDMSTASTKKEDLQNVVNTQPTRTIKINNGIQRTLSDYQASTYQPKTFVLRSPAITNSLIPQEFYQTNFVKSTPVRVVRHLEFRSNLQNSFNPGTSTVVLYIGKLDIKNYKLKNSHYLASICKETDKREILKSLIKFKTVLIYDIRPGTAKVPDDIIDSSPKSILILRDSLKVFASRYPYLMEIYSPLDLYPLPNEIFGLKVSKVDVSLYIGNHYSVKNIEALRCINAHVIYNMTSESLGLDSNEFEEILPPKNADPADIIILAVDCAGIAISRKCNVVIYDNQESSLVASVAWFLAEAGCSPISAIEYAQSIRENSVSLDAFTTSAIKALELENNSSIEKLKERRIKAMKALNFVAPKTVQKEKEKEKDPAAALLEDMGSDRGIASLTIEALQSIEKSATKSDQDTTKRILNSIVSNVLNNPTEEKYRRLKTDNPKFSQYILCHAGAMNILFNAGFLRDDDTGTLQLPMSSSLEKLREIKKQLDA
eukprot:GHVP01068551.1.p1 GENE.GHVP01068551.1~~GHVP01068551.1.p1  ORF type:complete len:514 (+),score=96.37 GHVP01068551.1:477-2018(+)